MQMQPYAETLEWEAVKKDFVVPLQAAGLNLHQANAALNPGLYKSPQDFRHAMVKRLQQELPSSAPRMARADISPQMPGDAFAQHEQKVKAATYEAAHASPTLRPVVIVDRSGRECTEFYGAKRSWMAAYAAPAMLMKCIGQGQC